MSSKQERCGASISSGPDNRQSCTLPRNHREDHNFVDDTFHGAGEPLKMTYQHTTDERTGELLWRGAASPASAERGQELACSGCGHDIHAPGKCDWFACYCNVGADPGISAGAGEPLICYECKKRTVVAFQVCPSCHEAAETRLAETERALRWLLDSIPHHEGDDNLTEPIAAARAALRLPEGEKDGINPRI